MIKRGFGELKKSDVIKKASNHTALLLPNTVFFDTNLAILEAVVEYLKEEKGLNYRQIGLILNRDERNIWTIYSRVRKKREITKRISAPKPRLSVPISVLKDRSLSGFEAIVEWLKDHKKLSFHEIGILLNRDERNIWTVYHRAKFKRGKHG
ncbi:hypothetical protein KY360_00010 [Candidatus Woesearchaeota archaeon]|nr:hypothetical protein [Candidatus Woesearchaeota archaeon]